MIEINNNDNVVILDNKKGMIPREYNLVSFSSLSKFLRINKNSLRVPLFPHVHVNGCGKLCLHLSPLNTPLKVNTSNDLKRCRVCGKMEKLSMFDIIYCNCIKYPVDYVLKNGAKQ